MTSGIAFSWIAFSIMVAAFAHYKRRSLIGWLAASLAFSPIFTCIILLCLGDNPDLKKCPKCAEYVHKEASLCRFCNFAFSDQTEKDNLPRRGKFRTLQQYEKWKEARVRHLSK